MNRQDVVETTIEEHSTHGKIRYGFFFFLLNDFLIILSGFNNFFFFLNKAFVIFVKKKQ